MLNSPPQMIHCPVCRARQPLQSQCRRCTADLALYCKALTAVGVAKSRYAAARQRADDPAGRAALEYLRWLRPAEAAQASSRDQV